MPGGLTQKEVSQLGLDYKEDLKKAKALISEAGYPNGFHLDLVGSEKRIYRNFYRILQEQLARIGIDCTVEILAHAAMHKTIRENPRAIVIYSA